MNNTAPAFGLHLLGSTYNKSIMTIERIDAQAYGGSLLFRSQKTPVWGYIQSGIPIGTVCFQGPLSSSGAYGTGAIIQSVTTQDWSQYYGAKMLFQTTDNNSTTPTTRMVIDQNGFVGINQTAPGSTLDVKGTFRLSGSTSGYVGFAAAATAGSTTYTLPSADGTSGQYLQTNGSGTLSWQTPTTSATAWQLTGNSGTTAGTNFIGTTDAKDLVFKTNNTERIRINSTGNVGIGTTATNFKLDVNGQLKAIGIFSDSYYAANNLLTLGYNFLGNEEYGLSENGGGLIAGFINYGNGNRYVYGGFDYHTGLVVDPSNGYVGIGIVNPTSKFEVNGQVKITGGDPGAGKVLVSDTVGLASWQALNLSASTWSLKGNTGLNPDSSFIGTSDNTDLVFKTNKAERLRIIGNGGVSVGGAEITGDEKLAVQGNARIAGNIEAAGNIKSAGSITFSGDKVINYIPEDDSTGSFVYGILPPSHNLIDGCSFPSVYNSSHWFNGMLYSWANEGWDSQIPIYGVMKMGYDGANGIIDIAGPQAKLLINYYCGKDVVIGGGGGTNPATGNLITMYDTYLSTSNGKVGVGSNLPTTIPSKLYVKGDGTTNQTSSFNVVNSNGSSMFIINDDGNVGIGTTCPDQKLTVNGKIRVKEEIIIENTGNWCDYVFAPNYKLLTFSELEKYIKDNKHLPGVKSASEMEQSGFSVYETNKAMMEKIEELTLYIIQLEKRVSELEHK